MVCRFCKLERLSKSLQASVFSSIKRKKERKEKPSMMVHACEPSTREADAGGFAQLRGQLGMHSEFEASQDYITRPRVKNKAKQKI